MVNEITQAIEKIKLYPKEHKLSSPATDEDILNFEKEFNIKLPDDFKEFLKFTDGGEIFAPDTCFFGISKVEKSKAPTLSEINSEEGRDYLDIPENYLIIGMLSFGDLLCIDLDDKHEIIEWDHEVDEEFCNWDNLSDYLVDSIDTFRENTK